MSKSIAFIDFEIGYDSKEILDIGCVKSDGAAFHSSSIGAFIDFISDADFLCGHNIINFDLKILREKYGIRIDKPVIDTLYLSPLLFPKRLNHSLAKDEIAIVGGRNNPVNDSIKAKNLFFDEVNEFQKLPFFLIQIFHSLLCYTNEFSGFFAYFDLKYLNLNILDLIRENFSGKICLNADINHLIYSYPVELAYVLSIIWTDDTYINIPFWLLKTYPDIENIFKRLRNTPCSLKCEYCQNVLNVHKALKLFFGYENFRVYGGEPLQEKAVLAAVNGKSVLAIFPTGGGKSLTFQLPALMAGVSVNGLTVVISPLQSLMKDQVDNLNSQGITSVVTINGLMEPIERANALERIENGTACLVYISPEQLRSKTITKYLTSRNVIRFVIDEAHCFSAWGQDFRIDYLYIGDFIKKLQDNKKGKTKISVSCFTATAKPKVITDICDYFRQKLGLYLNIFASSVTRENLRYSVIYCESNEKKYNTLRNLIEQKDCPTIVYVSRTKRAQELAVRLTRDGFPSRPFYGKMDTKEKIENQDAFIQNKIKIIVATSAFGMGIDKKDVHLVIHYDISSSLEDYVQEAGRAGRDPDMEADCFILFNEEDLDKHFILLNQTKLSLCEIRQVWKAIKRFTKQHRYICCSPLEIARQAGWSGTGPEIETKVKTAIQALETVGYVKRGNNMPHIYATSIISRNSEDAGQIIDNSDDLFSTDQERTNAKLIFKSLIGKSRRALAGNDEAESRIDYIADILGLKKATVIELVNKMRQVQILSDDLDMTAFIYDTDKQNKSKQKMEHYAKLEKFIYDQIDENNCVLYLKEVNEKAQKIGISYSNIPAIRTLLFFLAIKNYIYKEENAWSETVRIELRESIEKLKLKLERRIDICRYILDYLFIKASEIPTNDKEEKLIRFSLVGLFNGYINSPRLNIYQSKTTTDDVTDALLYLSKIGSIKIEGGFLVLYNSMEIHREADNRKWYTVEDYRTLDDYYQQRIQQIHIVGEYANLMVRDYKSALQYVDDYFQIDYKEFINKYFKGERKKEIERPITPKKYDQLFNTLSNIQSRIIQDKSSQYITVAAGPGSGKTRVLVHKLAALLMMEDVKHDQLLMLTFSRAAATEFKKRLIELVGNAANFVDIKTFHSYCFDLLGKPGSLDDVDNVIEKATHMILNGEVELRKISKSVLVIDEAQDMSKAEFLLVRSLMKSNEEMRVIAVGDDDQNIFSFRGSDSKYFRRLFVNYNSIKYEMTENYRSKKRIVEFSNKISALLPDRMKSNPGLGIQNDDGNVIITNHFGYYFIEPLVKEVVKTYGNEKSCVLTQTNDEAMQVLTMLEKNGVPAKLIQALGQYFKLKNLAEIRYFLSIIDSYDGMTKISDEVWREAKEKLYREYEKSACLEICRNLIDDFEKTYPDKYRTDLDEFINDSQYEDFYNVERNIVYVSTIHKAKGREFDNVYILLQNYSMESAEKLRTLYVGVTRAKSQLFIHCNSKLFNTISLPDVKTKNDPVIYPEPDEIVVQLTHKDVFLNYFKSRQEFIEKIRSGMSLSIGRDYLFIKDQEPHIPIVVFSKSFKDTLSNWNSKGYHPFSAEVQFVVAWKGENDEKDIFIVLPVIKLKKHR